MRAPIFLIFIILLVAVWHRFTWFSDDFKIVQTPEFTPEMLKGRNPIVVDGTPPGELAGKLRDAFPLRTRKCTTATDVWTLCGYSVVVALEDTCVHLAHPSVKDDVVEIMLEQGFSLLVPPRWHLTVLEPENVQVCSYTFC